MTEMTNSPLSGVGGGDAYIDRTVDKMSFVIFVMKVGEVTKRQQICTPTNKSVFPNHKLIYFHFTVNYYR